MSLTVKHVEDGNESLVLAGSVTFWERGQDGDHTVARKLDAFGCSDGAPFRSYSTGKVYVMNADGATVGVYDFT